MKFAKELEDDLVPEWRIKYFDYKTGKKKVKAVARALRNVNESPQIPSRQKPANFFSSIRPAKSSDKIRSRGGSIAEETLHETFSERASLKSPKSFSPGETATSKQSQAKEHTATANGSRKAESETGPRSIQGKGLQGDNGNLSSPLWDSGAITNYGSIIPSPPHRPALSHSASLELPDPVISPSEASFPRYNRAWRHSTFIPTNSSLAPELGGDETDAYKIGLPKMPKKSPNFFLRHPNAFKPHQVAPESVGNSSGTKPLKPPLLKRLFSSVGTGSPHNQDVPMGAYTEFGLRQKDFLTFLDKELDKIEVFYKMKETEATGRLWVLRRQLHEMRDRRRDEVLEAQRIRQPQKQHRNRLLDNGEGPSGSVSDDIERSSSAASSWIKPLDSAIDDGAARFGKHSRVLEKGSSVKRSQSPDHNMKGHAESWRDFTRRPLHNDEVPYRAAKRKLRLALREFYRSLELLKSYALLNRTAFRKINKKYDKAVKARPTGRYMSEKVNKAWFVQSEILEGHMVAVENLYARCFERGNHKVAVGKLRSKTPKTGQHSGSIFRNGLLVAAGVVLGTQGVVYGAKQLYSIDTARRTNTSYLLQIYGGYFLSLFLFLLFCLDCKMWSKAKINYVFIFEFDTRHTLDWHQLSEIPCFLLFLLGLFIWLNFMPSSPKSLYLYWPALLITVSAIILFFPGPIMYHRSRKWWAYSNFRLLLAGIYPVEFRDFFLGDMFCSQTYSLGNLELFFCLYAQHWNMPALCNSSNSRLLGFFTTLPGIWRALQCLRRYYDTRNSFPHLVNCGKYIFTILYYMTLSMYRIDKIDSLKALFITCATINSVYCSIWDLAMDWSLCNPYAPRRFLREVLGYKRAWVYYAAMLIDPILRFNWIFYAIFNNDLQHSALLSFFVGFSEVCRRAIWTLFRVENEHCTNVERFRAARDVPLPYDIPILETPTLEESVSTLPSHTRPPTKIVPPRSISDTFTPFAPSSGAQRSATSSLRRRRSSPSPIPATPIPRSIARVGTAMTQAHAQDFERRRPPSLGRQSQYHKDTPFPEFDVAQSDSAESSDDGVRGEDAQEQKEDAEDLLSARDIVRRQKSPQN